MDYSYFLDPYYWTFNDESGVAEGGAGQDCGDAHGVRANVGTASVSIESYDITAALHSRLILNREAYMYIRLKDASANEIFTIQPFYRYGTLVIYSDEKDITIDTSWLLFYGNPFQLPTIQSTFYNDIADQAAVITIGFNGYHSSSTTDVYTDYTLLMPRPLLRLDFADATTTATRFALKGRIATAINSDDVSFLDYLPVQGDVIEFIPNQYNVIQSIIGDDTVAATISWTLTYSYTYVTPRFEIV